MIRLTCFACGLSIPYRRTRADLCHVVSRVAGMRSCWCPSVTVPPRSRGFAPVAFVSKRRRVKTASSSFATANSTSALPHC
jgi:hypothetical protein